MRKLVVLLALAVLAGCKEEEAHVEFVPRPVVSEIIQANPIEAREFTGTVAAVFETDLGFQAAGRMIRRPVSVGDVVTRGTVLAELDPADLENTRRAALAGVTAAEVRLETAQRTAERVRELAARGIASVSKQELAEQALSAAKAEQDRSQAVLLKAEDARSFATLVAPVNGVVTQAFAEAGTVVSSGQAVVRLAGTARREAVIDLPESAIEALGRNAAFDIRLRSSPTIRTSGRVSEIEPVADTATRTRRVHLELADQPEAMRLGALVLVRLTGGGEQIVSMPTTALIGSGQPPRVWRVSRPDGQVSAVPITVAPLDDGLLRVLSGVTPGDEIVIKGVNSLKDGQMVGERVQE
ncbi:efflux RND transporter periplasmic adaptor subunit [Thalassovita taeanensis]|uniref:RND family efflux transporter, MFP subunit n=1 Tax=Thalassovita taeanensis TaxID=657014 RepID=A0A1H8Z1Y7_9RHOB|nr:efflux RND transporter periplasmic adaptor subunit [Thalassovita taeanensis]SEP58277.1 RND family efflux transporter, MFP subunit [Thalassovita taeanensis]